jgi:formylglycine-generating enzyme required for sulfatase activity
MVADNRVDMKNKQMTKGTRRAGIIVGCALIILAAITALAVRSSRSKPTLNTTAGTAACEACPSVGSIAFAPTASNSVSPPGPVPAGMVWIPGGEFSMGSTVESESLCGLPGVTRDALPVHRVYVDGFWMDKTELTNEEFEKFVQATGYVTIAERTPTKEEFPNAPPENLVAGSTVFTPTKSEVPLDNYLQWWSYVKGADWRHPEGPRTNIKGKEKYPVVQIAYDDAVAYAKWAGKRLPTEAEWEFAARGGLTGKLYSWGDDFRPNDKPMANTYQGKFPVKDTGADGFAGLAPVASFAPNGYGLYDVAGNAWEWVSDWYRSDYYQDLAKAGGVVRNPKGPASSLDPAEPLAQKRVQRGGSFLCTDQYCSRYMVGTRGKGEVSTASNHLGVRLVMDAR